MVSDFYKGKETGFLLVPAPLILQRKRNWVSIGAGLSHYSPPPMPSNGPKKVGWGRVICTCHTAFTTAKISRNT